MLGVIFYAAQFISLFHSAALPCVTRLVCTVQLYARVPPSRKTPKITRIRVYTGWLFMMFECESYTDELFSTILDGEVVFARSPCMVHWLEICMYSAGKCNTNWDQETRPNDGHVRITGVRYVYEIQVLWNDKCKTCAHYSSRINQWVGDMYDILNTPCERKGGEHVPLTVYRTTTSSERVHLTLCCMSKKFRRFTQEQMTYESYSSFVEMYMMSWITILSAVTVEKLESCGGETRSRDFLLG